MTEGSRIVRFSKKHAVFFEDRPEPDIDRDVAFLELFAQVRKYSMTDKSAMYALYTAARYLVDSNIPGDFVECGVWRGGSALLAGLVLQHRGIRDRSLYLYDTFEGMSAPTEVDVDMNGHSAAAFIQTYRDENGWCYASLEDVRAIFQEQRFDFETRLIKGDVAETLAAARPTKIALLRLDTDWYASTKAELEQLYPRLSVGGVLIVDDYGHWAGARRAVDEYFSRVPAPLLVRVNYSVRLAIKLVDHHG